MPANYGGCRPIRSTLGAAPQHSRRRGDGNKATSPSAEVKARGTFSARLADATHTPRSPTCTQCLLVLNLENFIAARALGRRHLGAVALGLADQRARNGRGDRNLAVAHVGLVLADDLVFDLVAGILVLQRHGGAELDLVAAELGRIDHLGATDLVLDFGHLGLVETLRLLGSVVLGIFGQIAVLSGVRNLLNNARALLDLEAVQLGLELLEPLDGHRHFFHGHGSFSQIGPDTTTAPEYSFTQALGFGQPSFGGEPRHPQDASLT